jgi:lipopolysaccharide heptosyltransferase II
MDSIADWKDAKRILCVRLDNMGDVLMSTPAIRALKEGRPDRHVTLWTSPGGRAIAQLIPEIDNAIGASAPWMKVSQAQAAKTADMVDVLRSGAFDAAVIMTVYSQSPLPAAMMCHLAGIRRVLAHCRENPYHLISHWEKEPEPQMMVRHEVLRQLALVGAVGANTGRQALSLRTRPDDAATLRRKLLRWGMAPGDGYIVAHCGATATSRRYPAERFARAVAMLVARFGPVYLTGSSDEFALVDDVCRMAGAGALNLAGKLSIGEMAALVGDAAILVSNNTGPVHMAAALQTPVVVLYALTNPQHTPWQVPHRVLNRDVPCRNCYQSSCPRADHPCLAQVEPREIVAAVQQLLAEVATLTAVKVAAHPETVEPRAWIAGIPIPDPIALPLDND